MKFLQTRRSSALLLGLVAIVLSGATLAPERGAGAVASDHVLASQAGAEMLSAGGNAVDAAVAMALSAGVVQPAGSGLGGGGFAVVVLPDGTRTVVDFREHAPAGATREMYQNADGSVTKKSRVGGDAVAVPGESRGLAWLLKHHGTLSPRVVANPAVRQAQAGFPMGAHLASGLNRTDHQEVRLLFGRQTYAANDRVTRPKLAATLRKWAATAGEDLHTGASARAIVNEVQQAGGRLTADDLANYKVAERAPIVIEYRGYTVITMPPPSSGGIVLAQVLRVLEGYELAALGHNSADYVHVVTEAMKHAYADRAHYLGDADFVEVPVQALISDARVQAVRGDLWPGRTFGPDHYGLPVAPPKDSGTRHISVMDAFGGAVALTTTINTSFGSGVVVEGTGMVLNNEMDDFSAAPGVPNAYGLIGGEENAIEPGKRPLSSMSPTVLIGPSGNVEMVVGASGGSKIISATLQAILNRIEFGMDAQDAVAAPRFHHQWQPDMLALEFGISPDTAVALEARGHKVIRMATRAACDTGELGFVQCFHAAVQMVARESEGVVAGAADPRKGGRPVAVKAAN